MSDLAVIKTGGKQYLVKAGDKVRVEKLEVEEGKTVKFDALLVADEGGKAVKVGKPTVAGVKVEATVEKQGRAKKVTIIKFRAKVRYKRKAGHRQPYTLLRIDSIK
ncbi:MAG: 50S ribosomal protein L21 [Patescibacteria group bacterium]|nr:50S ribosomal protein L21 [Patescibacteria group bacterium]